MNEPFIGENIKELIEFTKSIRRAIKQMQNGTEYLTYEEVFMKCNKCKQTDCKHENVKYHSCCLKVRCDDCGQEWETRYLMNQYYVPYVPYIEPVQPWVNPYLQDGTGYINPVNQGNVTLT